MKYILISSKEIIVTYILSFFILILSGLIYNLIGYDDTDFFIKNIYPYITILFTFLASVYIYKINYKKQKKFPLKKCFPLVYMGISIALVLNMLIFLIKPPITTTLISPILLIISTGIIGPIYEEILFRYLLYNRLKLKYSSKKSILITSILFALIHLNIVKIIYAFIIGLVMNIIYEKHNNIIAPILIHISANTIVIFLYEYNTYILLLSFINLIISVKLNMTK